MRKALLSFVSLTILSGAFPLQALAYIDSVSATVGTGTQFPIDVAASNDSQIGFWYRPGASHNVCTVDVFMQKTGNPTDSVGMQIRLATSSSATTGHLTADGALLQQADSFLQFADTSGAWRTFTFTPCAVVVGDHDYEVVVYRSEASNPTNGYYISAVPASNLTKTGTATTFGIRSTVGFARSVPLVSSGNIYYTLFRVDGTENFGATTPSTTPSFSQSVIDSALGINDSNATTSSINGFQNFLGLQSVMESKFPFNYVGEIFLAVGQFAYGTTTNDYAFQVNFGTSSRLVSTSSASNTFALLPSVWDVISSSTMSTYYPDSVRLFWRNLLLTVVIFAWGFAMYYRLRYIFGS